MLNIRDDFFNIKLSVLSLLLILHLHEVYILKLQVIFTKKKKNEIILVIGKKLIILFSHLNLNILVIYFLIFMKIFLT